MKAPGRNSPCWCESGKKYKHCHRDIESQPSVAAHTVLQALGGFRKNKNVVSRTHWSMSAQAE
ncbi:SEC-C metal-binding domain-containing protein [Pseudomonas fulva]|uniref:SEC-C metal-binding domain-containing protein n=1 Tax=Pseudomonas fulva TaxID=47880 RepID=UPI003AEF895C